MQPNALIKKKHQYFFTEILQVLTCHHQAGTVKRLQQFVSCLSKGLKSFMNRLIV